MTQKKIRQAILSIILDNEPIKILAKRELQCADWEHKAICYTLIVRYVIIINEMPHT